jgi:FKBP-type peptidyl-prolyl cis-trans isomerase FklB
MKNLFLSVYILLAVHATANDTVPNTNLKNLNDSASYLLGYDIGRNLIQRYPNLDLNILSAALGQAFSNKPSAVDPTTIGQVMNQYTMLESEKLAAGNKKAGEEFLKTNKTRPGVITTSTGLQFEILKQGTGKKPTTADVVKVHYEGKLLDGSIFDASTQRGEPAQFGVTGVIAGWTEALQLMPVGSKYRLFIPSDLAYGNSGAGGMIKPGATLIFDVELLEIIKQAPAAVPTTTPKAVPKTKTPVKKPVKKG